MRTRARSEAKTRSGSAGGGEKFLICSGSPSPLFPNESFVTGDTLCSPAAAFFKSWTLCRLLPTTVEGFSASFFFAGFPFIFVTRKLKTGRKNLSSSCAQCTYVPVRIVFPLPQPSFLLISGCPFLTAVKNSRADQVGSADRGMGADQEGRPFSAGTLGFLLDREESLSISWYSDCSHKEEGFAKKDRRKKMPRQQTRARMRVEPIARKVGFLENYVGKKVRSFVHPLGALSHCLQLWPANVSLHVSLLSS